MKSSINEYILGIIIVLIISPVLFFLMIYFFPNTFHCPFLIITGKKCFLCGTTTAIFKLFNFEFKDSIKINPLGIIFVFDYILFLVINFILLFVKYNKIKLQIFSLIFLFMFSIIILLLIKGS